MIDPPGISFSHGKPIWFNRYIPYEWDMFHSYIKLPRGYEFICKQVKTKHVIPPAHFWIFCQAWRRKLAPG